MLRTRLYPLRFLRFYPPVGGAPFLATGTTAINRPRRSMRQLIIATSRYKRRSRLATTILQSIRGNRSPSGAIDPPDSLRARARNFDFLFWKLDGHPSTRQSSFSWSTFPEELYSTERPDDWRPKPIVATRWMRVYAETFLATMLLRCRAAFFHPPERYARDSTLRSPRTVNS